MPVFALEWLDSIISKPEAVFKTGLAQGSSRVRSILSIRASTGLFLFNASIKALIENDLPCTLISTPSPSLLTVPVSPNCCAIFQTVGRKPTP